MKQIDAKTADPCVQICTIDWESGLCIGCSRTEEEIKNWPSMPLKERKEILKKLKNR